MYKLQYLNITREVQTEQEKDLLVSKGYTFIKHIEDEKDEKEFALSDKLNSLKVDELKALADKNNIAYDKSVKKDELIQLLADAEISME